MLGGAYDGGGAPSVGECCDVISCSRRQLLQQRRTLLMLNTDFAAPAPVQFMCVSKPKSGCFGGGIEGERVSATSCGPVCFEKLTLKL